MSFVSSFDRFSLTIPRWLLTSGTGHSRPGNHTTPRDVTGIVRSVFLVAEIAQGTIRANQIADIAILFGLLAVFGLFADVGFFIIGHRAKSATRVLSHANPKALLISAARLLELEATLAAVVPGTEVPFMFLWQIGSNKVRLGTLGRVPRLCFEMDSARITDTDVAVMPVGTQLRPGMCFVVRDLNRLERQIRFIPHASLKLSLRMRPEEITALISAVKSVLVGGPATSRQP